MNPIPLHPGIIYGPVRSRRLGASLGLNILPVNYKLCSFDCIYCQCGWTAVCTIDPVDRLADFPAPENFGEALKSTLREQKEIDNITFSGNGEPTLHPRFEELVDIAKQLKEEHFPEAKLGVLSNSSTVSYENVPRALAKLDFRIMKLEAGSPETFRKINRPHKGIDYGAILSGLKSLDEVTLQTMFVDGSTSNTSNREVREWMERVGEIKPMNAQIYSLHRPPADSSLREVSAERLREIAAQTEAATGIAIEVVVATFSYRRRTQPPKQE